MSPPDPCLYLSYIDFCTKDNNPPSDKVQNANSKAALSSHCLITAHDITFFVSTYC